MNIIVSLIVAQIKNNKSATNSCTNCCDTVASFDKDLN